MIACFFLFSFYKCTRKLTLADVIEKEREQFLFLSSDHFSICRCRTSAKAHGHYFYGNVHIRRYISTCPIMNPRVVRDLILDNVHRFVLGQLDVPMLLSNVESAQ